jgi:hypothetical protein
MIGSTKYPTRASRKVDWEKARPLVHDAYLGCWRVFFAGAALLVMILWTIHQVETSVKSFGEVPSVEWLLNVAVMGGSLSMLGVVGFLLGRSLWRNGVETVAKVLLLPAILKEARNTSSAPSGRLVVSGFVTGTSSTQVSLALKVLQRGPDVIVIDGKGNLRLRRVLQAACERAAARARREQLEELLWNEGDENDIATALVPEAWFSDPYYLRVARRHVVYEVRILRARGIRVNLEAFLHCFTPSVLRGIAAHLPESLPQCEADLYLNSLTPMRQAFLSDVLDRMRNRM